MSWDVMLGENSRCDPGGFVFFCLTLFVHVLMLALQESFCLKRRSMLGEVGELIWLDFPSLWQE